MLADIPATLLNRLQSVLDASARSIAGLRRSDHFTATLASFHWLHVPVPERIQFKQPSLFTELYTAAAPRYLCDQLRRVADMPLRNRL